MKAKSSVAGRFSRLFLISVNLFCAVALMAQDDVDRVELEKAPGPVEFISNEGTPTRIDTREQIWNIGSSLKPSGNNVEAGSRDRYFVIHKLYAPEFDKLDADIFGLGPASEVDHIRNLRLIIQGYLENAYSYSRADAALLSEFITIYNAVYRKNRTYFTSRYKTPLLNDLTAGKEGLSLRYDEWPGQTLMLIPLQTAIDGSLSAVDTTAITSEEVVSELRKDDDKGIDQRQQMVDLKEREAEAASQKAAEQREAAAEQEKQIADSRSKIEEDRKELEKARETATEPEQQAALDEKEEELNKQEAELAKQEETVGEQKEAAAANEALAERKEQEAQTERTAISEDQRQTIAAVPPATAPVPVTGVLGVKLPAQSSIGTPVIVNLRSGEQLKTSPLNTVNARTLTQSAGKLIASAGESGANSTFKLIQINEDTLETVKTGDDEIQRDSLIWVNGNNLYAVMVDGGRNYLARFNTELVRQARSEITVHQQASLLFQGDRILTQNESGSVVALNAQNLTVAN